MTAPRCLLIASLALTACPTPPRLPDVARSSDAPEDTFVQLRAFDGHGEACSLDDLPRSFELELLGVPTSARIDLREEGPTDDAALLRGLVPHGEPLRVEPTAGGLRILVEEYFAPGTRLALRATDGRSILARHTLVVGTSPHLGARLVAALPADGTPTVPSRSRSLWFAFDGEIGLRRQSVRVRSAAREVAGYTSLVACGDAGLEGVQCARFDASEPLPVGLIDVELALDDARGSRIPVAPLTLRVVEEAPAPAFVTPSACPIDEVWTEAGCILLDDEGWRITLRTSSAGIVSLEHEAGVVRVALARGEGAVSLGPLASSLDTLATLRLTGLDGAEQTVLVPLRGTTGLPSITLREVCADPEGPEPASEWIEIENFGGTPVPLEGLWLSDDAMERGRALPRGAPLAPGEHRILAPDGFDAAAAGVPPGTLITRTGRSILSGLSNSGERLFLRDDDGRRVSASPAVVTGRGECLVRVGATQRRDTPSEFVSAPCTPGR